MTGQGTQRARRLWITEAVAEKGQDMADVVQVDPRAQGADSARGRVRRVLIEPMIGMGFRHPGKVSPEDGQRKLDQIADDLAHLTADQLATLRDCLRSKGEGSRRVFWPARATVLAFAEVLAPRPLEHMPRLVAWFRSAAGADALAAGRHVAEWLHWERRKAPPLHDMQKRAVAQAAQEMSGRAERLRERRDRGAVLLAQDAEWLRWYEALDARVRAVIAGDA